MGRRRACGRRPMTACGRRGVAGVQAACGTVRGTHTRRLQGLGRGVRPNGRRPASAFVYGGLAACWRGRAWPYTRRHMSGHSACFAFQHSPVWPPITQNSTTEVDQVINSKVVDLLILYHFHKGCIACFSTISAQIGCQDAEFLGSSEEWKQTLTWNFHQFALQTSNATQHENCVPRQNTHFCVGRIWSV
jgi:hypothetical protein